MTFSETPLPQYMAFEGRTPLNIGPIEIHAFYMKSKLLFLPRVTIFRENYFDIIKAYFIKFLKNDIIRYIFR